MQPGWQGARETKGRGTQMPLAPHCPALSPFEGDPAICFGGHDPNGIWSTNKAWVQHKGLATPVATSAGKPDKSAVRPAGRAFSYGANPASASKDEVPKCLGIRRLEWSG